jgi:hypothetical protein
MWKILLYGLLIWFLYNFIFRFAIPVYRATRQMKKQFRQMRDQMEQQRSGQDSAQQQSSPPPSPKKPVGDYIDFEEIK